MARNCAVIVGINDYAQIAPLKYAKSDAERMRDFFMQDLGVSHDDLYFFTDDSPCNAQGCKTQPTYGTLKSFLGDRFANSFLTAGDTLWFYFSGHGMSFEGRDYLLPSDGNRRSIPDLAIPIGFVTERLRRSGADNVVMLIDACRSDGAKNAGMGIGEEKQQGVITFFSCSPSQVSYEIDEIGQGAFTNVLLEALRERNCATVERFDKYLRQHVPLLTQQYKNYAQNPYTVIEPLTKYHYILLPHFARPSDISLLREDAYAAESKRDFVLAFQLWLRINVAAGGTDIKAIEAFQRLANKQPVGSSQPKVIIPKVKKNPPAPPVLVAKENPVELVSAKGIDYRDLKKLLKAKEWRDADVLTAKHMLKVASRENEGWLNERSIMNFSCEDLRTIDQLWGYYSNSKFGFSAQKKLWLECGGEIGKCDDKVWKIFTVQVGWHHPQPQNNNLETDWFTRLGKVLGTYTEFMNDTQNGRNALSASLPLYFSVGRGLGGWDDSLGWYGYLGSISGAYEVGGTGFSCLFQRLVNCNR